MNSLVGGPGISVSASTDSCYQTGILRWNSAMQRKEVMSNDSWVPFNESCGSIMLDMSTLSAIEWVQKKMSEEAKLNELCQKHPGLKDLKEKYEIMLALVQEHENDKMA